MSRVSNLEEINALMVGWTVTSVQGGNGEDLFIINLEKGKNRRCAVLAANDLGGWLSKKSTAIKKKKNVKTG